MGLSDRRMEEGRRMMSTENVTEFVRAKPEDVDCLRSLAFRAEAHWGYDEAFMEVFDRTFNVTESFILENPAYVLWEGRNPAAFWGLRQDAEGWELEYFYVSEQDFGRGYGRYQAIGFYEKMGAAQDGTTLSAIDQRPIPHFTHSFAQ